MQAPRLFAAAALLLYVALGPGWLIAAHLRGGPVACCPSLLPPLIPHKLLGK